MTVEIKKPKGAFLVIAQLTNTISKGHRYAVMPAWHSDGRYDKLDQGTGRYCNTIEQARTRILCDIASNSKPDTFGGLIDWGTMAAREYAIFPVTFGERIE